ncbi:exonuclease domain-containing protein [Vaginisenegalia massiliensis]|uniref:exonuclease domain-containing protein n=1 Tax=Vaginisenegalia massiliensis TaxID=2058294 RepID=UPI0013DE11A1|nr:exonuclease domain-containing protein [Vaginisenegalia massiliensis]
MSSFIALDVETANQNTASICSIGLVKFTHGQIVDQYYQLINPQENFSWHNMQIHHITPDDVHQQPTWPQIHEDVLSFIADYPIVAHNAPFDMAALSGVMSKYQLPIPPLSYLCTVALTKQVIKDVPNHRLNTLANYYQLPLDHHNALSDALICGQILNALLKNYELQEPSELASLLGYPRLGCLGQHGFNKRASRSPKQTSPSYKLTPLDQLNLDPNHPFYQQNLVITGSFKCAHRQQLLTYLIKSGAIIQNQPTQHTHYLLCGQQNIKRNPKGVSTKTKKALELIVAKTPIHILNETDLLKVIENYPIPRD